MGAPVSADIRFMKRLLLAVSLLQVSCFSQPSEHLGIAGRDIALWRPKGVAPSAGYPLIVFSHGCGGCNTQSSALMDAFSGAGYVVLAPNHQDARCGGAARRRTAQPEESFRQPDHWNDRTYRDRAEDVEAVLDAVLREKTFHGISVDAERIGLAGHSLGGYTVLGLAGAWPSWKDARVKAVLALSPFCAPYLEKGALGHMSVPVMYQGGTLDLGITPFVRRPHGAFDSSSAPKYYVEFNGAGHFAWTNLNPKFQPAIGDYSVAFFDRYLKSSSDRIAPLFQKPYPRQISSAKFKST